MSKAGKGSIYAKLFHSYLATSLIPVLCLAMLTVLFAREYSIGKVKDELSLVTQGVCGVMQGKLEDDKKSLQLLVNDADVVRFVQKPEVNSDNMIQLNQKMFLITGGKMNTVRLHLIGLDGSILHSTTGKTGMPPKARSYWGILRKLQESGGMVIYSGIYSSDEYGVTMALPILSQTETVGYAMLCITEQAFANTIASYSTELPLEYMIVDKNRYLVLDDVTEHREMFLPLEFRDLVQPGVCTTYDSDIGSKILAAEQVGDSGLLLAATVSVGLVVSNSRSLTIFVGLLCLAVLIITLIVSKKLAREVVQPIQIMCDTMDQIEAGNMEARVPELGDDELGTMGRGFNLMIQQLEEQFRTNLERQDRLRIAEFKNLQAQIAPHFLYNTLESIKILARLGMNDDVVMVVSKLGILLRSGMVFKQEMIPLRDELRVVESYVAIQQVRYEGKFTYSADISPELMDCLVPNLVIQPLVENAVVHGIEAKVGSGELRLTGWLEDKDIYIEIYDNGGGIDPEKLTRIFQSKESSENVERESIGMINVHRRLQLYFGEPYGLTVESELGSFTRIRLRIPKVEGGEYRVQNRDR